MSSRLEELRLKSWPNLNSEERAEYQKLIAEEQSGEKKIESVPQKSDDERIKKLEEMVAKLSEEKTKLGLEVTKLQEGWSEYVPPAQRNKRATVKIYRENAEAQPAIIVKAVVFKQNDWNEETHKYDKLTYTITLRYDDGTTKDVRIDAREFAKIKEIEKVEIVKEDRRTLRKIDGYTVVPEKDKDGYPRRLLSSAGGYGEAIGTLKVPLEVFTVKSVATVKRSNGQEFQIDNDYLNL